MTIAVLSAGDRCGAFLAAFSYTIHGPPSFDMNDMVVSLFMEYTSQFLFKGWVGSRTINSGSRPIPNA